MPKTGAAGWSYIKFRRRALDWATVGVAAVVESATARSERPGSGSRTWARRPCGRSAAEQALAGAARDAVAAAAEQADTGTEPPDDTFASSEFRRRLARVLTARAVEEALSK